MIECHMVNLGDFLASLPWWAPSDPFGSLKNDSHFCIVQIRNWHESCIDMKMFSYEQRDAGCTPVTKDADALSCKPLLIGDHFPFSLLHFFRQLIFSFFLWSCMCCLNFSADILHTFTFVPRNMNFIEHTSRLGWKEWVSFGLILMIYDWFTFPRLIIWVCCLGIMQGTKSKTIDYRSRTIFVDKKGHFLGDRKEGITNCF